MEEELEVGGGRGSLGEMGPNARSYPLIQERARIRGEGVLILSRLKGSQPVSGGRSLTPAN